MSDMHSDDSEQLPKAKQRRKRDRRRGRGSSHGPGTGHTLHIDEKWLVSYSDMMTLLFGLFVMLYSIASENQGNPNQIASTLKAISGHLDPEKRNPDSTDAAVVATPTPTPSPEEVPPQVSEEEFAAQQQALQEAQAQAEKLREELTQQQAEKDQLAQEKAALEEKLANLEGATQSADKEKDNLKKALAKKTTDLDKKEQQVTAQMQALEESLKNKEELTKTLEENLAQAQKEIETLKRETASQESQEKLLLLSAHWKEEKFDVDLELTSPSGVVYGFKNKIRPGSKTVFLADASKGPGTELIYIDALEAGNYTAKVKVYNSRGATDPAMVNVFVMSPFGRVSLGEITLDGLKKREQQLVFTIEKSGRVTATFR